MVEFFLYACGGYNDLLWLGPKPNFRDEICQRASGS
jgi:hypothetical protein